MPIPSRRPVPGGLLVHLRRARDHADLHYAEPLDLAALAAVAGISKFHIQRLFTATYGASPAAHVSRRRVERAQDLLAERASEKKSTGRDASSPGPMITGVSIVSVFVTDIDASKAFYIDVLGFVENSDITLGNGYRWCAVDHPDHPELVVTFAIPARRSRPSRPPRSPGPSRPA